MASVRIKQQKKIVNADEGYRYVVESNDFSKGMKSDNSIIIHQQRMMTR